MPFYRINGCVMHLKLSGKAAKNPPKPCCGRIAIDGIDHRCADISTFLCDWPLEGGGTCDAPLCATHAHATGPDRHLCPRHLRQERAERPELF